MSLGYFVRQLNLELEGLKCAIQGYGNVGRHVAEGLAEQGASVVAVSDAHGAIQSCRGLDIGALNEHTSLAGTVHGFRGAEAIPQDQIFELDVDVLVPAALGGQITQRNALDVKANFIAEGSNGPIDMQAGAALESAGVMVIPDILANAGGIIVSHAEWIQNRTAERWPLERVEEALHGKMLEASARVFKTASEFRCSWRLAAYVEAARALNSSYEYLGIFP